MKTKTFHEKIYNTRLLLIYDCKAIEAETFLSKKGIRVDLIRCVGQTGRYIHKEGEEYEQKRYYIYVEKKQKLNTLLHEISHLVFMSLFDCGIEINQRTDEIFVYYFEWWFNQLHRYFK